jgi:hypothetical protein
MNFDGEIAFLLCYIDIMANIRDLFANGAEQLSPGQTD